MDTTQLMALLQCDPQTRKFFLGVFPKDQLPRPPVHQETYCFILNSDNHDQKGTHWLAVFRNRQRLEFFDSYGFSPEFYGVSLKEYHRNIYYNTRQIQSAKAVTCGLHCAYFITARCRNIDFETIVKKLYDSNLEMNDFIILMYFCLHLQSHAGFYCQ